MDFFTIVKELKKIEPDKDFSVKSRNLILNDTKPALNVWQVLWSNIEFGASLALMVVLFSIMVGGFSTWKFSAPLQISNLDPAGLRAEAQAIDLQIQLTNLNYEAGKSLRLSESTRPSAMKPNSNSVSQAGVKALVSTSSEPVSIDEALDKLSK